MISAEWKERYRVRIGLAFGLLFIWRAQPRFLPFLFAGLLIAFLGVALRQWAAGCLRKNDELATAGPYSLSRNPLYLGSFLAALGFIMAATSFSAALSKPFLDRSLFFWCFLWILAESVYWPKILKEEENLRGKFGAQYDAYAGSVPRVFPRRFKVSDLDFSTFRWDLYRRNNEFWSVLGYLAICAILIARYVYRR